MASECESELNIEEEMSNVSVHIPQNLNWIWSQKSRQLFHKVLQIVSNPENETGESSAAQTLLFGPTNYCPGLPVTARSRNLLPGDKIKTCRVTEQVFLYFKHIFMYVLL